MSELKPCPFCGSEAAEPIFIGNDHTKQRKVTIKCETPGCAKGVTVGALRFSQEWCHAEAVKKWNTRTVDAELTAAKARIAELEEALEPFAREAAEWSNQARDDDFIRVCSQLDADPVDSEVTVGDLRRAAALLKDK